MERLLDKALSEVPGKTQWRKASGKAPALWNRGDVLLLSSEEVESGGVEDRAGENVCGMVAQRVLA